MFLTNFLCLNKLNYKKKKISLCSWLNKLNKQTDLRGKHSFVLLCLDLSDPATFLASNSVLGTLFSSQNSLFIHLWFSFLLQNDTVPL